MVAITLINGTPLSKFLYPPLGGEKPKLEKVVASKQLRLAVETEEERIARLENDAATKWLRLALEMDGETKARLEKMVATTQLRLALIKGVVNVGAVLSLKPKLDALTT